MSDEVYINGIHFDNNTPKWATDQSLKRLSLMIKNNHQVDKRQQDRMVKLLGGIHKAIKDGKSQDDKTLNELKKMNKSLLAQSSALEKISKSSQETSTTVKKETKVTKNITNNITKKGDTSSTKPNDTGKKAGRALEEIQKTLEGFYSSYQGSIKGSLGLKAPTIPGIKDSFRPSVDESQDEITRDTGLTRSIEDVGDRIESILDGMARKMGRPKAPEGLGVEERLSMFIEEADNMPGIIEKMNKAADNTQERFTRLRGALNRSIRPLMMLGKVAIPLVALGKLLDVVGTVTDALWTSQQELLDLTRRGIDFSAFNTGLQELSDSVRADGVVLRRMITEAGLLAEQGMKLMQDNAALVNRIGVAGYFKTIADVAGSAHEADSFMNQMLMDRKMIAEATNDYIQSLMRLGRINVLESENREITIRNMIRDTSNFSRAIGVSIEQLRKTMLDQADDDRMRLLTMGMDDQQIANLQMGMGVLTETFGSEIGKMFQEAIFDPTGAGLFFSEGGPELIAGLERLTGGDREITKQLNDLLQGIRTGDLGSDELGTRLLDIRESLKQIDVPQETINALLAGNAEQRRAATIVQQILKTNQEALQSAAEGAKPTDDADEILAQQRFAETARDAIRAHTESERMRTMVGESGLEAAKASYQLIVDATNFQESMVTGIADIASTLVGAMPTVVNYLGMIVRGINQLVWWRSDEDPEKEAAKEQLEAVSQREDATVTERLDSIVVASELDAHRTRQGREVTREFIEENLGLLYRARKGDSKAIEELKERGMDDDELDRNIQRVPELIDIATNLYRSTSNVGGPLGGQIEPAHRSFVNDIISSAISEIAPEDLAKSIRARDDLLEEQRGRKQDISTRIEAMAEDDEGREALAQELEGLRSAITLMEEQRQELMTEKRSRIEEQEREKIRKDQGSWAARRASRSEEFNQTVEAALQESIANAQTNDTIISNLNNQLARLIELQENSVSTQERIERNSRPSEESEY